MNVGATDRGIRVILGVILLSLIFIGPKSWWGLVGLVPLATAGMSFCPLYRLIGLSTVGK